MAADVVKAGCPTRGLCALGCKWVLVASLILLIPAVGYAQEATFTGAATDSTGGVLPGVAITAVHEASGNIFTAVTNDRGEFRLPVRVGGYAIRAELSGFTTVNRNVQILVGQTAVLNIGMAPSAVQETVTVTGAPPLVDMTTSTVGANIDPRQDAGAAAQRAQLDGPDAAGAGGAPQ